MMALARLFFMTTNPRKMLMLGVVTLLALPTLRALWPSGGSIPIEIFAGISVALLLMLLIHLDQGMLGKEAWVLQLPAGRSRVYDAMHLGLLASVLPTVGLIGGGMVLADVMPASAIIDGLCTMLFLTVVILALRPIRHTWPSLVASLVWVPLGMAVPVLFVASVETGWIMPIIQLLAIVPIYWAGRRWFARFDAAPWQLRWPIRVNSAGVAVAESSTPRASDAESPGLRGLSPSHPTPALLPGAPGARLFVRACWLRWAFAGIVLGAMAFAFVASLPPGSNAVPILDLRLLWLLILGINAVTAMHWLRNQLDVLLPLRRSWVYQAFTSPVMVVMLALSLAAGIVSRSPEPVTMHGYMDGWTYIGRRVHVGPDDLPLQTATTMKESMQLQRRQMPIIAEQVAHDLANRYGVRWTAEDLLREDPHGFPVVGAAALDELRGAPPWQMVTTAHLTDELRSAARWQALHTALFVVVVALAGAAFGLLGPWVDRWRRGKRVVSWVAVALFALPFLPLLLDSAQPAMREGVPLIPLTPRGMVLRWMLDYRYAVAAALAVLAAALHWRNHRAFVRADWVPFGRQAGPWRAGRRAGRGTSGGTLPRPLPGGGE